MVTIFAQFPQFPQFPPASDELENGRGNDLPFGEWFTGSEGGRKNFGGHWSLVGFAAGATPRCLATPCRTTQDKGWPPSISGAVAVVAGVLPPPPSGTFATPAHTERVAVTTKDIGFTRRGGGGTSAFKYGNCLAKLF